MEPSHFGNIPIKICYQNVRGLRTKLKEFYMSVSSISVDLFAVTETGCNDSIADAELVPPRYTVLRCDRVDGRKHGGVCLVASPRLELRRVILPCDLHIEFRPFEIVCATVYLKSRFMFMLCIVYTPPNTNDVEYFLLLKTIEEFCSKYDDVLVIGDFNLYSCSNNVNTYFWNYFSNYCEFSQCNNIQNVNGRLLDLVLSKGRGMQSVAVCEGDEPLVPVDDQHPPLLVCVRPRVWAVSSRDDAAKTDERLLQWNFKKADFNALYSKVREVDWSDVYSSDLNLSLNCFYYKLNSVFEECVPKNSRNLGYSRYLYPKWYTKEVIKKIKQKASLHKRYKVTKSPGDYKEFSCCRAEVKKLIALALENYTKAVKSNVIEDPKSFWRFINSNRVNREPSGVIENGEVLPPDRSVKAFAEYFSSVYVTQKPKLDVSAAVAGAGCSNGAARVHVGNLQFSDIQEALKRLKPKKGSRPERRVIPVPKVGCHDKVEQHRPIAILSSPAKVLETALQKCILNQVSSQLSEAQHGFRSTRSTTSNLLNYMANISPVVDSGKQVDAAYFDIKKAFDLVDNDVLLQKFAQVGFTPHLLNFMASFMEDRMQYVEYAGCRSEAYFTRSGVTQGSNLGPMEFMIMLNDLPKVVKNAKCLLFADDIKLYMPIESTDDCIRLQEDIDRVVNWSRRNRLGFNLAKCKVISFSRARFPTRYNYTISGLTLARVSEVKDLGVYFNANLGFAQHVEKTCKKA
ncbi:unnamed protein product [Pieris macdunnoughi]|uniref:Reverse transcriptase domain-containing protein n=1 Tax=Pieris macdunnoughi TaxID=345717 RepID=A0A821TZM2_9NEOP|nr:unnamed protein product [Pieris macdunnoughi]